MKASQHPEGTYQFASRISFLLMVEVMGRSCNSIGVCRKVIHYHLVSKLQDGARGRYAGHIHHENVNNNAFFVNLLPEIHDIGNIGGVLDTANKGGLRVICNRWLNYEFVRSRESELGAVIDSAAFVTSSPRRQIGVRDSQEAGGAGMHILPITPPTKHYFYHC